jgi:hypothetical protein
MSFSSWPAQIGVEMVGYVEILGADTAWSFAPTLNTYIARNLASVAWPSIPFFSGEM